MQRVLSTGLWKEIKAIAVAAKRRRAAVAYVTQDLIGFKTGDVLVLDATERAIRSGETDAKLLRRLHRRGVQIHCCADLHAKVLLLDEVAVIGSGNMSRSSTVELVEAALITDHSSTVSGVASLIEQLASKSEPLTTSQIADLCRIPVLRKGGRSKAAKRRRTRISNLGDRTWLLGVEEMEEDPPPVEQREIDRAQKAWEQRTGESEELSWIRCGGKGRFTKNCREGDQLIQVWRKSGASRPTAVLRATPVLLKTKGKSWTRFYVRPSRGRFAEISWGRFRQMLRSVGFQKAVGHRVVRILKPDIAEALARKWTNRWR